MREEQVALVSQQETILRKKVLWRPSALYTAIGDSKLYARCHNYGAVSIYSPTIPGSSP
jgi:hypothetical protein